MNKCSSLKKALVLFGILILLLFSVRHPQEALNASQQGMKLWLNTLLPTLLPFIILTNILIKMNLNDKLFHPFRHFWHFLLDLSPQGTYVFFTGLLCGYPMGAKITSDLYDHKKISKEEAHYLLCFSNNASPAFIINYLYITCLKKQIPLHTILMSLFISTIFCMLIARFVFFRNQTTLAIAELTSAESVNLKKETSISSSFGTIIDVSIMNGFETITRSGGYILLFSLLSAVINHYHFLPEIPHLLLSSSIELTTGLHQISSAAIPFPLKFAASAGLTSFGGFSILAQTRSVLSKQLSIIPYICAKLLNTALCVLLVHIFLYV